MNRRNILFFLGLWLGASLLHSPLARAGWNSAQIGVAQPNVNGNCGWDREFGMFFFVDESATLEATFWTGGGYLSVPITMGGEVDRVYAVDSVYHWIWWRHLDTGHVIVTFWTGSAWLSTDTGYYFLPVDQSAEAPSRESAVLATAGSRLNNISYDESAHILYGVQLGTKALIGIHYRTDGWHGFYVSNDPSTHAVCLSVDQDWHVLHYVNQPSLADNTQFDLMTALYTGTEWILIKQVDHIAAPMAYPAGSRAYLTTDSVHHIAYYESWNDDNVYALYPANGVWHSAKLASNATTGNPYNYEVHDGLYRVWVGQPSVGAMQACFFNGSEWQYESVAVAPGRKIAKWLPLPGAYCLFLFTTDTGGTDPRVELMSYR